MPETQFRINPCENGIRFSAVIQPRSSQNEVSGIHNNSLKIRLTSPPVDGAANKTCIKFLAKWLGVSPSRISIVAGLSNKNKTIEISGMDESVFRDKLITKIPNLFNENQS
ncbi:MAG: hypothetical protein COW89_01195 [Nitrospinae bacterium CG22_combo_CG10-13_8_21_14_all_47_10]|jgi:hypothetical protein|nr:MAG: hypothetical protein COW89_01195 [Nitrospinae bacterium CG22_combo_CG10-13_8_21_14_all_47_10]